MSYDEFHRFVTSRGILRTVSFFFDLEVAAAHCSIISFHRGKIIVVEFLIAYASFRSWDKRNKNGCI
jgi:hypothetical protein